jgi:hypothetical protein
MITRRYFSAILSSFAALFFGYKKSSSDESDALILERMERELTDSEHDIFMHAIEGLDGHAGLCNGAWAVCPDTGKVYWSREISRGEWVADTCAEIDEFSQSMPEE